MTPTERRLLSDVPGPVQSRLIQRDYAALQKFEWLFTAEQAETFNLWWTNDLLKGGAWFLSTWPLPYGWDTPAVRRFVDPPAWVAAPGGVWRVSAVCEIRGASLDPQVPDVSNGFIGWFEEITEPNGVLLPGNSGSRDDYEASDFNFLYAGWVDYESGTVIWDSDWTGSDPAPTLIDIGGGRLMVTFYRNDLEGISDYFGAGVLTLTATKGSADSLNSISAEINSNFYSTLVWDSTFSGGGGTEGFFVDSFTGSNGVEVISHTPDTAPAGEYVSLVGSFNQEEPYLSGDGDVQFHPGSEEALNRRAIAYVMDNAVDISTGVVVEVTYTPLAAPNQGFWMLLGDAYGDDEFLTYIFFSGGNLGIYADGNTAYEEVGIEVTETNTEIVLKFEITPEFTRISVDGVIFDTQSYIVDFTGANMSRIFFFAENSALRLSNLSVGNYEE